jgi:23S rRNA pseudouridine1911/1915/1917 synthase
MKLEPKIIFEDQDIVVVEKPAGVVSNQADSVKQPSLQEWFIEKYHNQEFADNWTKCLPEDFSDEYGSPAEIFAQRQGLVHRLDKNTSGIMVFAKNPGSLINLLTQFRLRQTKKQYLALVHGVFRVPKGTITAPLARARADRRKFAVDITGRAAETIYEVVEDFAGFKPEFLTSLDEAKKRIFKDAQRFYNQGFSLVRCWPKTGRTHQIRVHLAHESHPLVGDVTYLGKKRAKIDPLWCDRHFLHAESLEFVHPRTQEELKFIAKLPLELEKVLAVLVAKK